MAQLGLLLCVLTAKKEKKKLKKSCATKIGIRMQNGSALTKNITMKVDFFFCKINEIMMVDFIKSGKNTIA